MFLGHYRCKLGLICKDALKLRLNIHVALKVNVIIKLRFYASEVLVMRWNLLVLSLAIYYCLFGDIL